MRPLTGIFSAVVVAGVLLIQPAAAQPRKMERSVEKQRAAVAAWTKCIVEEQHDRVAALLVRDFRTDEYRDEMKQLGETRVSSECFEAMPRAYRRIRLAGLPFAGGLAEHLLKQDDEPLLNRLSMATIGPEAPTYSYTDSVAMCTVRGAPHLVAALFDTNISSEEEAAVVAQLKPVSNVCTRERQQLDASVLALRSMLATASYRLLAVQKVEDDA